MPLLGDDAVSLSAIVTDHTVDEDADEIENDGDNDGAFVVGVVGRSVNKSIQSHKYIIYRRASIKLPA